MASFKAMVHVLALAAWLVVPAAGREYWPPLRLSGACAYKNYLNNMIFDIQGFTAGGAPWYKGATADGVEQYLYWDPDCGGGGDGQSRWILTDKVPNPLAMRDLDGDNLCNYHARVNGRKNSYPPNTDFWFMDCGAPLGIRKLLIVLGDVTTTSTSTTETTSTVTTITETTTRTTTSTSRTTTSKTTTSTSRTTTSRTTTTRTTSITTTTTTTVTEMVLGLTGACPFKFFLNRLTFSEQGRSLSGSRYYKAVDAFGADQWMYYDQDCNGESNGAKRWIIGPHLPLPEFQEDLDQDLKCNYHAHLDDLGGMLEAPPRMSTWQMYCGLGWTTAVLDLSMNSNYTFYDGLDYSPELRLRGLFAAVCPQKAFLDNTTFRYAGNTASGAPYYVSLRMDQYIYYEPHCTGNLEGTSRWVIDAERPSLTAQSDLDGDGTCDYHARAKSKDTRMPPKGSMWRVKCGGESEWKDMWLALIRLPMPTATTTTTQARMHSAAAGGSSHFLAVLLLGGFVHFLGRS